MVLLTLGIQLSVIYDEYITIRDKNEDCVFEGYFHSSNEFHTEYKDLIKYLKCPVINVETYFNAEDDDFGILIELGRVKPDENQ